LAITNPPCSAVSLRQQSYLSVLVVIVVVLSAKPPKTSKMPVLAIRGCTYDLPPN